MKAFTYIIFLVYIKISLSITPFWNLEAFSYNLLEGNYLIKSGNIWGEGNDGGFEIYKNIYKNNGVIQQEHYIILNYIYKYSTEYEDIESAYLNEKGTYFICPKGKFHVHFYNRNNGTNGILSVNLNNDTNWDLKCYYQLYEHTLFIGYLNSPNHFYQYDFNNEVFKHNSNINNGLYAFRWRIETWDDNRKQMFAIVKEENVFNLKDLRIRVKEGEDFGYYGVGNKFLCDLKSNYLAMIRSENHGFYYINYNDQFDFESGYYNEELTVDNIYNIEVKKNEKSVFTFTDKISIKEMKFIYDTRFVYYKIFNEDQQKFYYGIIDVSLNKIIFNTDKKIQQFKPFDSNSMLAITDDSAYKICAILEENDNSDNFKCKEQCDNSDQLRLDTKFGNKCVGNRPCFWDELNILKPENICIEKCDENYYIQKKQNLQNECWLCKDLNSSFPYKLINRAECFKDLPQNSQIINKELFLVKCIEGYNYFENGNCVKNCSDNFFLENQDCQKCNESCKACETSEKNCTKCYEGEYLKRDSESYNTCNKCSEKCETCSDGEEEGIDNCLSCKKNSTYEFLLNKNCVEVCPEDTQPNDSNICIKKDKTPNKKEVKIKDKVMLSIFIIITGFMLILIIFLFYKNICCKTKNNRNFIEDSQSKLIENKEIN